MRTVLRDYQSEALETLRDHIRAGRRKAVLSSPTGSGKTVVASALCEAAVGKGSRVIFAVDRIALAEQTSARLNEAGIEHGVIQGANGRRQWAPLIVASQQTLERRKTGIDDYDLIIVDECHTQRRAFTDWLRESEAVVIGLSATPFSTGLAETYDAVVNTRTTDQLVEDGWLIAPDVLNGTPADLSQAKTSSTGEWTGSSVEKACSQIVGDVLIEWETHAEKHFGGVLPPTLVFTPTIAYGESLCKLAQSRGHVWEQVTAYTPEEERSSKIEGFREGRVKGLVGCEWHVKGFDVPSAACGISTRAYKTSLASVIQQIGRIMRPDEGKDRALWLDHVGNFVRFQPEIEVFWSQGCDQLSEEPLKEAAAAKRKEREDSECVKCGWVYPPEVRTCPMCGAERPKRRAQEVQVAGRMEVVQRLRDKAGRYDLWPDVSMWVIERTAGRKTTGEMRKQAAAAFRDLTGDWPRWERPLYVPKPESGEGCAPEVRKQLELNLRRWLNKQRKQRLAA